MGLTCGSEAIIRSRRWPGSTRGSGSRTDGHRAERRDGSCMEGSMTTLRYMSLTILLALVAPRPAAPEVDGPTSDAGSTSDAAPIASAIDRAIDTAADSAIASPTTPAAPASTGGALRPRWGLNTSLGFGGTGGDFGTLLQDPIAGDFNFFGNHGKWRFGLGLSFSSFKMKEPYQDEPEWGFQQTYLFATRMFRKEGQVRPYLQVRGGLARLHPRSALFDFQPPPETIGDSPTHPGNGFSVGLVPA